VNKPPPQRLRGNGLEDVGGLAARRLARQVGTVQRLESTISRKLRSLAGMASSPRFRCDAANRRFGPFPVDDVALDMIQAPRLVKPLCDFVLLYSKTIRSFASFCTQAVRNYDDLSFVVVPPRIGLGGRHCRRQVDPPWQDEMSGDGSGRQ
jgi:hypothetical protein